MISRIEMDSFLHSRIQRDLSRHSGSHPLITKVDLLLGWFGNVLIDQNGVSIGIHKRDESWASGRLVSRCPQLESTLLELLLDLADILKIGKSIFIAVPSGLYVNEFFSNIP